MKMRLIIVLALGLSVAQAHAAIVTFSGADPGVGAGGSRPNSDAAAASFDAAAGALGTLNIITFEPLATGFTTNISPFAGVNLTTTGTVNDASAGITTSNLTTQGYNTTSGGTKHFRFVPQFDVGTATATFSFAAPIQAFGTYLTGLGTANGNLAINFNDGSSQSFAITGSSTGGVQFFGFTDAGASISSVSLQLSNVFGTRDIFGFDDVRFVAAVPSQPNNLPVPAPAWLGLVGASLVYARAKRSRIAA